MKLEQFKKLFNESFRNVTPDEFVKKMQTLGYKFKDIEVKSDCVHPYNSVIQDENGLKCTKCNTQLTD